MTQDDVIRLAREAGMVYREFEDEFANANTDGVDLETLEVFVKLVAEHEREACAIVGFDACVYQNESVRVREAIRARGQA